MKIDIIEIFKLGVDYGQLLMEEERRNEELFNAGLGTAYDKKFTMPLIKLEQRQLHSKEWFLAKQKSVEKLQEIFCALEGKTEININN